MTKMTHPLPWDYFRCKPFSVDAKCENCKRWLEHPDQEMGPRTAFMEVLDSKSVACAYHPSSFMEKPTETR